MPSLGDQVSLESLEFARNQVLHTAGVPFCICSTTQSSLALAEACWARSKHLLCSRPPWERKSVCKDARSDLSCLRPLALLCK